MAVLRGTTGSTPEPMMEEARQPPNPLRGENGRRGFARPYRQFRSQHRCVCFRRAGHAACKEMRREVVGREMGDPRLRFWCASSACGWTPRPPCLV